MPQLHSTDTHSSPHVLLKVYSVAHLSAKHYAFTSQLDNFVLPSNHQEAMQYPCWQEAFNAEIATLEANHTWEVVDLPASKRPIDYKIIYRIKHKSNAKVERCKIRIVAKGFTQQEEVDYMDTFSTVAKMSTIRVLVALAAANN